MKTDKRLATLLAIALAFALTACDEKKADDRKADEPTEQTDNKRSENEAVSVESYEKALAKLDATQLDASKTAAEKYLDLADDASNDERDALFSAFYRFYRKNLDNVAYVEFLSENEREAIRRHFNQQYGDPEGERVWGDLDASPFKPVFRWKEMTLEEDVVWMKETFRGKLGPASKEFLDYLGFKEETNTHDTDDETALRLANVEERLAYTSGIMERHPDFGLNAVLEFDYIGAFLAYLAPYENRDKSYGVTKYKPGTTTFTPEMEKVARKFVENHPGTRAAEQVGEFVRMIVAGGYEYQGEPSAYVDRLAERQQILYHKFHETE
ncbi:MAG: hypothetical protein GF419_03190 [Ignavibacteriales bacterium]|nr:hypothetical protein [Ignavibacteriales bacterium]